jgi:N-acetylmuramoyl-L-alanine amidase
LPEVPLEYSQELSNNCAALFFGRKSRLLHFEANENSLTVGHDAEGALRRADVASFGADSTFPLLDSVQLADLQKIAEIALAVSRSSGAAIAWGDSRQMECAASSGDTAPPMGTPIDPAAGLARECIRNGELAWCADASTDVRVSHEACEALGVRSLLYLPVFSEGREISGLLGVFAAEAGHFTNADVARLKQLADSIGKVLSRRDLRFIPELVIPEQRAETHAEKSPAASPTDSRPQEPHSSDEPVLSTSFSSTASRMRIPFLTAAAVGLVIATAGWASYRGSNGVQAKSTAPPVVAVKTPVVKAPVAEIAPVIEPEKTPVVVETKTVVVIDPGHGGRDVGTKSSTGLLEKDLTLDIAQRLGELLKERLGCDIVLTRTEDKFVPLETRASVANSAHADFLISIHGNSSSYEDVRGIETYYYRPNIEVSDAETDPGEAAKSFANDVQSALLAGLKDGRKMLRDRGVKSASFVVLREVQMPAALSEISFMSSNRDAEQLDTPQYRDRVAEALYKGISNHLSRKKAFNAIADLNQKKELGSQATAASESR